MTNSAENLERVKNTMVLHNVKHAWLNLTSAIHREYEARLTLTETMAYANQELDGLIGEQVAIGAIEWFQASETKTAKYLRQTAGPDHDFKLAGEFLGISLFDENEATNLAPNHKADPARLCLALERAGVISGQAIIPIDAVTDGIALMARSPLPTMGDEEL